MKVNEIVKFPTQLIHVETVSIKAEKKSEKVSEEFSISANIGGEIIGKRMGKSVISIKIENEDYYIETTKSGIFEFDEEIKDEDEAKYFMEIQGVRILWSYIREDIYTISARMLSNPIMIPTIDVLKTIQKAQ